MAPTTPPGVGDRRGDVLAADGGSGVPRATDGRTGDLPAGSVPAAQSGADRPGHPRCGAVFRRIGQPPVIVRSPPASFSDRPCSAGFTNALFPPTSGPCWPRWRTGVALFMLEWASTRTGICRAAHAGLWPPSPAPPWPFRSCGHAGRAMPAGRHDHGQRLGSSSSWASPCLSRRSPSWPESSLTGA